MSIEQQFESMATHVNAVVDAKVTAQTSALLRALYPVSFNKNRSVQPRPATPLKAQILKAVSTSNFSQSIGMDVNTGKTLTGIEHLQQSLRNIIQTPKFQRVMRRDYGSDIYAMIDAKSTQNNLLKIYAELAESIDKWEPRFNLKRIVLTLGNSTGQFILNFIGDFLGDRVDVGVAV